MKFTMWVCGVILKTVRWYEDKPWLVCPAQLRLSLIACYTGCGVRERCEAFYGVIKILRSFHLSNYISYAANGSLLAFSPIDLCLQYWSRPIGLHKKTATILHILQKFLSDSVIPPYLGMSWNPGAVVPRHDCVKWPFM